MNETYNQRPFTLDFLKKAAHESKNLDEFLAALRAYKDGELK